MVYFGLLNLLKDASNSNLNYIGKQTLVKIMLLRNNTKLRIANRFTPKYSHFRIYLPALSVIEILLRN